MSIIYKTVNYHKKKKIILEHKETNNIQVPKSGQTPLLKYIILK
jgi:hypothetical protein